MPTHSMSAAARNRVSLIYLNPPYDWEYGQGNKRRCTCLRYSATDSYNKRATANEMEGNLANDPAGAVEGDELDI